MKREALKTVAVALALSLVSAAWANDPGVRAQNEEPEAISLFVGRSTVVETPWPVKTVSVTEPGIADVEILRADKVLVMGKAVGSTDIILLGETDEAVWKARIDIDVDVLRIKSELARLFPGHDIDARQSEDVVIVSGALSRSEQVEQLHEFLDANEVKFIDLTRVAGVQQVQVQVRLAEASRTALRSLGINALQSGIQDGGFFGASLVGSAGGGAFNPVSIGPPTGELAGGELVAYRFTTDVTVSPLVTLLAGFPRADLEFFIQALAENAYLRILAEPNLVALNGETASFLAGGEFPIPVVQGGQAGGNAITIEYKEFGVRLNFRPTVLGDNRIRLHVAPEVSSLSDAGAVELQGFRVPAVVTRRAETTVELKSGETFAMAGLLQQTNEGRNTRVPGLGDLPILGALFRSTRYEKGETELVVLVTASLVEPMLSSSLPPLPGAMHVPPSDWEVYAEGRIEGRPATIASADAMQLKTLGLDRLKGPGAWASHDRPAAESEAPIAPPPASRPERAPAEPESSENG